MNIDFRRPALRIVALCNCAWTHYYVCSRCNLHFLHRLCNFASLLWTLSSFYDTYRNLRTVVCDREFLTLLVVITVPESIHSDDAFGGLLSSSGSAWGCRGRHIIGIVFPPASPVMVRLRKIQLGSPKCLSGFRNLLFSPGVWLIIILRFCKNRGLMFRLYFLTFSLKQDNRTTKKPVSVPSNGNKVINSDVTWRIYE